MRLLHEGRPSRSSATSASVPTSTYSCRSRQVAGLRCWPRTGSPLRRATLHVARREESLLRHGNLVVDVAVTSCTLPRKIGANAECGPAAGLLSRWPVEGKRAYLRRARYRGEGPLERLSALCVKWSGGVSPAWNRLLRRVVAALQVAVGQARNRCRPNITS